MVIGVLETLEKFRWVGGGGGGGPVNYSVTPVQTGSQELGVRSLSGLCLDFRLTIKIYSTLNIF